MLLYHEVSESEKFRCYEVDKKTSDATRDVCYDDYNKQFNRNFPLYAFTLLLLSLVLGVYVSCTLSMLDRKLKMKSIQQNVPL